MAKTLGRAQFVREVFQAMPHLKRFPSNHMWIDYDRDADVLYMSFEKPQRASDSVLQDDNVLLRYRGRKLVGITIIGTKTWRLKI
ncbi:MAG: DUF2283 domain-containing protein [Candidatus Omnitrophica bacterium]|nr:DUF2283 domain-containing protein [Candidatus Omnitrophota bacterium]MBI3020418.1 DUF2283 domain-containing protein [Candidatus Omnitrophota bacterium]